MYRMPLRNVTLSIIALGSLFIGGVGGYLFVTTFITTNTPIHSSSATSTPTVTPQEITTAPTKVVAATSTSTSNKSAGSLDGYTLFAPIEGTTAYLIDMNGKVVHTWNLGSRPGMSVYLQPNGDLLATYDIKSTTFTGSATSGGGIELLNWNGTKLWSYELSNSTYHLNHDISLMPNGDILAIAFEALSYNQAIALGFPSSYASKHNGVWSEAIFEIDPKTNNIVWEWHAKDHLLKTGESASAHPELLNPAYVPDPGSADWLHFNAIDYNSALNEIVVSSRNLSEFYFINHNTTTSQAAGSAGDLLYRWGNPAAYGASGTQELFGQHDVHWMNTADAHSDLLIFNNGDKKTRPYSTADEVAPGSTYGKATLVWQYGHNSGDTTFFSDHLGSVQRLSNGNTFIGVGVSAQFLEINPSGKVVWNYTSTYGGTTPKGTTSTSVFRATRYTSDYAGVAALKQ